jgi:hypothetical protein
MKMVHIVLYVFKLNQNATKEVGEWIYLKKWNGKFHYGNRRYKEMAHLKRKKYVFLDRMNLIPWPMYMNQFLPKS